MKQDKVLALLGLARKAGKTRSGSYQAMEAIRAWTAVVVVIAQDASPGSTKQLQDKCRYRGIVYRTYADMETLGACTGSGPRACIAVCDEGFAKAILKELGMSDPTQDTQKDYIQETERL